eukprot:534117_1
MFSLHLLVVVLFSNILYAEQCSVIDHGAVGDGKHDDTNAIQSAFKSSSCNPVYFPIGTYRVGSIQLIKNKIYIMQYGATLVADPTTNKWNDLGLFYANNQFNMTFINITMNLVNASSGNGYYMTGCQRLIFESVSIINPSTKGSGGIKCVSCGNIYANNCIWEGHIGLSCTSCSDMFVNNTFMKGNDDALAMKAYARNMTFLNGIYWSTNCNAIIIGSETYDEFYDIKVQNAIISGAGKGGISIECMDGANITNVMYKNITMEKVTIPIWMKIGNRNGIRAGSISNVTMQQITATNTIGTRGNFTSTLVGLDYQHQIGPNINLLDINIVYKGGGIVNDTYLCPANNKDYYNPRMFGVRPAYGFDIQNVNGLNMDNITLSFEKNDDRPAFVLDNANNCLLNKITVKTGTGSIGDIVQRNASNVHVTNAHNAIIKTLPPC